MDASARMLKQFIEKNGIDCQQYFYKYDVSTSEACVKLGIAFENIIKTIIMLNERKEMFAIVLRGDHRIHRQALRQKYKCRDFRLATAEEILSRTGYPLGGVPPFGFAAQWLIDEELMNETDKEFYAGGGSTFALVKLTPREIVRVTKAKTVLFSRAMPG